MEINQYIDHTFLKPTAKLEDIEKLCKEALKYHFASVCIPPNFVKTAKKLTEGSSVAVGTVIGFPFGYSAIEAKVAESLLAIVDGADELDMVVNISAIKNGDWTYLSQEISHLAPIIKGKNKILKIIIESGVLSDDEIIKCCRMYGIAGIDFLKTSTGYAAIGATVHAVKLFKEFLPANVGIKASGGIRDYKFAKELIEAGATRIGCSAGIKIVQEALAVS